MKIVADLMNLPDEETDLDKFCRCFRYDRQDEEKVTYQFLFKHN